MNSRQPPHPGSRKAFGFLTWKEHWTLSVKGKILLFVAFLILTIAIHWVIHPFLAINRPLRGQVLIVEGWLPVHSLSKAAAEFTTGSYRRVLVVRSVYEGDDGVTYGRHSGEYASSVLTRFGVPEEKVNVVFFTGSDNDRTYHSALSARKWLSENGGTVNSFDVATLGPHARRSRLLYQKAFGETATVGIISLPDPTYDPTHWWRSSEGVRQVFGESLAYLYARIFFSPSPSDTTTIP